MDNKFNNQFLSLLFSFYLTEDFDTNLANQMHFALLEKYHHLFSKSLFVIIIDDPDNSELIKRFEQKIISCGFINNVKFEITENTYYHEAYVFKKYLVDKLNTYEGLVFFAHNKGVTNVKNEKFNETIIALWIYMLYVLSLNYIDEAFETCIEQPSQSLFFGGLYNIQCMCYNGTIYLLSPSTIVKYLKNSDLTLDDLALDSRWYAEEFPGKVLQKNKSDACDSFRNKCAAHALRRHYILEDDIFYGKDITRIQDVFRFLDSENFDSLIQEFYQIYNKIKSN